MYDRTLGKAVRHNICSPKFYWREITELSVNQVAKQLEALLQYFNFLNRIEIQNKEDLFVNIEQGLRMTFLY